MIVLLSVKINFKNIEQIVIMDALVFLKLRTIAYNVFSYVQLKWKEWNWL